MAGNEASTIAGGVDDSAETPESRISISIFLGLLILMIFVLPSIGFGDENGSRYGFIVISVLLCSGVSIAWQRRRLFLFSGVLAVVAISARFCAHRTPSHLWVVWSEVAVLASTLIIAVTLLLRIFSGKGPVTRVSIQAAIAVYLLFGTAWSNAYILAMQYNPQSFHSAVALSSISAEGWLYYSFVTLTTLGYGDITPVTQIARSLASAEALTGQLYLAVLIARLIGREMSSSR
jgi:hypothetical protein